MEREKRFELSTLALAMAIALPLSYSRNSDTLTI